MPVNQPSSTPADLEDQGLPPFFHWILPGVAWVLFVATLPILFTKGESFISDPATARHLASGRLMWERAEIITQDPFSYTLPEGRWVRFEWLSEGIAWGLMKVGGLPLLSYSAAVAFALIPFCIWKFLIAHKIRAPAAFLYSLLTVVILHAHFLARPFLFTYLFTILVMMAWSSSYLSPSRKTQYGLPLLFLLWCNLHAGFVGGLLFLMLAWIGSALDRHSAGEAIWTEGARLWLKTILLSFFATLINPYGIGLLVRVFETIFLIRSVGLLDESNSLSFSASFALALGFFIVLLSLVLNRTSCKIPWVELLPVVVFLYFGFKTQRHVFILMLFAALPVARIWQMGMESLMSDLRRQQWIEKWTDFTNIQKSLKSDFWLIPLTIAIAFFIFKTSGFASRLELGSKSLPLEVRNFISQHLDRFQKPIHHTGNAGALMYYFYPKIRVMIDDRMDFYGDEIVTRYLDLYKLRGDWRERLDREGYDSMILEPKNLFVRVLPLLPHWKKVYEDSTTVIYWREN